MVILLDPASTVAALLPALAANGAPVLLRGQGTPLDGGRRFVDGRPLLGKGKTYEGLLAGFTAGAALAYLVSAVAGNPLYMVLGALSSLGALIGDIIGAFAKRRLGLPRGAPAPILDQLDFYSGAILALLAAGYAVDPVSAALGAPVVVLLHRATNMAAHRLGFKNVPW